MQLRRAALRLLTLLCVTVAAPAASGAPPPFAVPPDDVSSLTGDGWRVLVEPDGSFVIQSGRRYVGDVTLRLTSRPKNDITMQNFDGSPDPGFPALDGAGALSFAGAMKEKGSKQPVRLSQTLAPLETGVGARYALTVDEPVPH